MNINIVEPWIEIVNSKGFNTQLSKEISNKHPLYSYELFAIAKREDCDDVLFQNSKDSSFVIIHLTWSKKLDSHLFPRFEIFNTVEEINKKIVNDNKVFIEND